MRCDPAAQAAKQLRDHFVFKLIPVLNPDGVVVGNQRVNLSGSDLNRRWREPSKGLHPTVYATKSMLRQLQADREVFLFTDLHGRVPRLAALRRHAAAPLRCRCAPSLRARR